MTLRFQRLFLAALLGGACPAQTAPPAQTASPAPTSSPAPAAVPASRPLLRAQYQWGYVGAGGQGKGTLSLLLDPATGRAVLELQGLGERLMLLEGDRAAGYRVQIPRQKIDASAPTLDAVPLPFLPRLGGFDALYLLVTEGTGAGVTVTKSDKSGPVKLKYQGNDDDGKEVMIWLTRTRWEPQKN
jgi:hypothetical protein